jgi:hypothetical protein
LFPLSGDPAESEDLIFHDKEECRGGIEKR